MSSIGRLKLRRVAVARSETPAQDIIVSTSLAWSRQLWGKFLPDRRRGSGRLPPGTPERRGAVTRP